MLTILQVIPELDAGGAERTAVDIAGAITAAGGTSLVASQGGRLEAELAEAGAELIRLPVASKNPYIMLRNASRLEKIIRARNVDVIHARSRAPAWSSFLAARSAKIPFVTTYHGAYKAGSGLKKTYNSIMAAGDITIANSDYTAEQIQNAYNLLKKKISVIPRGTDMAVFDLAAVGADRVAAMRASWGLSDHTGPIIFLPGRLTRWKGQLILVEAMRRLEIEHIRRDAVVVMAGDAQGRDGYVVEVRAAILEAGLEGIVRVVDHITDMPAAYVAASLVVSASIDPEAFGRVPVEAGAMQRPVIATDHGGAIETVITEPPDIVTGWRVMPGDAPDMAKALAEALSAPPDVLEAMGARGRAYVGRRFSREAMCRATLQVYLRVIDGQV